MSKVNPGPHEYKPVANVLRDWDDNRGYLDTQAFADYSLAVRDVIAELGEPCIGEIKRAMPDVDHRYLFDAIEALSSIGAIRQTREVSPLRWASHTPFKPQKKRRFMIGIAPRNNPTPDALQIFGIEAIR